MPPRSVEQLAGVRFVENFAHPRGGVGTVRRARVGVQPVGGGDLGDVPNRATAPLRQLLEPSLGPLAVIGEELALPRVECVVIFGSWADRYQGQPGPPPNDIDVLVIGDPLRAEVYDAADRAQTRLGLPVNPILRTSEQWATNNDPLVEQVRHSPNVAVFEANGEQT